MGRIVERLLLVPLFLSLLLLAAEGRDRSLALDTATKSGTRL